MTTKTQVQAMEEAYQAFLTECQHLGITDTPKTFYTYTRAWIASLDHNREKEFHQVSHK